MVGFGGGSRRPFRSLLLHKAWNPVVEVLQSLAVSCFLPIFFCPEHGAGDEKRRKVETEVTWGRTGSTWKTSHKSSQGAGMQPAPTQQPGELGEGFFYFILLEVF